MKKINTFIDNVSKARKRTAIVFMEDELKSTINEFNINNVKIIDCCELVTNEIIFSDDQLLKLIFDASLEKRSLIFNLELFIAPRINEYQFLKNFIQKLMAKEPLEPVFILFYSKILYDKFKNFYKNYQPTEFHFLDNLEGEA